MSVRANPLSVRAGPTATKRRQSASRRPKPGRSSNTGRDLNSAITKSYGAAPDDIARIDASLLEMAINAIPELVMAAPDDFENVKARVLQSFIDAGAETSYEFWQGRWNELWEQYGQ